MAKHPPKPSGWMTVKETCEYLGIAIRTLYRLIDHGEIPAYRMARVIRLQRHDVDAWLESVRIKPGTLRHLYPHDDGDEN